MRKRYLLLSLILLGLVSLSFTLSLFFGGSELKVEEVLSGLFHPESSGISGDIIWRIRLPRIILGLLIGAGLASSGAVLQGLLRNPLAEPYTLGLSGGAALGATLGIVLGLGTIWLPCFAFFGALLCIFAVYIIASKKHFSIPTLILGGVILTFLFSSCVMLLFAVSKTEGVHSAILWLMGDLSSAKPLLIKMAAPFVLIGIAILITFSRDLNLLTLGEEKAAHLGVNVETVKRILFVASSLITGTCVAASGIIGFVGLIIPHFIRRLSGPDHRALIPFSALAGAVFLVSCDTLARTIFSPIELPVGVITGIFGGFFFLTFLLRSKKWEIF